MRKPAVFIALALLGAAAGALSYRHFAQPKVERATTIAPALSFSTLDGKTLALSSLRGRWVLINFWASWCAPCMDELPHLVAAQSNYGSLGLQIIGPALDEPAAVQPLLRRFQINYPVAANFSAGDAAMREFGNDRGALPFSVLIDPDGFVAERVLGGMSAEQLEQLLRRHLGRS
ncbi:TlpA family protein disulfide reductase [Solimonas flava]|uniref:TlpA family protein disulfide reductase n=1 Tax=Solimonas flava TaxID=415849 RepID=UPI0003FF182E|nr:TlpA disulfide reductase family protein [Solimonas flava]